MLLIGLTGPKGVGKTAIARAIVEASGGEAQAEILSFAAALKAMLVAMLREAGLPESNAIYLMTVAKEAPLTLLQGRSLRYAMQTLGTEWGRVQIDGELWTGLVDSRIKASDKPVVVIDDVRFANEQAMIASHGGKVVQLTRPGVEYTGEHPSEQALDSGLIDYTVPNDREPILCARHILRLCQWT